MAKEILVCNAKKVWRTPANTPNEKYFLIDDGKKTFLTQVSLEELAGFLIKGVFLSEPLYADSREPKIVYKPKISAQTIYEDGFFGRPLIPVEVIAFSPLRKKQVKELEEKLNYLR